MHLFLYWRLSTAAREVPKVGNSVNRCCRVFKKNPSPGKILRGGISMYILSTKADFDSAHFLKDYEGKCANIHGHRWTVSIDVKGKKLTETGSTRGMIVDFSELKKSLRKLTKALDHSLIMEEGALKKNTEEALSDEGFRIIKFPFRPTAENFAKYFYDKMTEAGYNVAKVSVYETPNNVASFIPDED